MKLHSFDNCVGGGDGCDGDSDGDDDGGDGDGILGRLGPGLLGPGQLGPGQSGPGAELSIFVRRTVGLRTEGPIVSTGVFSPTFGLKVSGSICLWPLRARGEFHSMMRGDPHLLF